MAAGGKPEFEPGFSACLQNIFLDIIISGEY
jgi:hypothetical protein